MTENLFWSKDNKEIGQINAMYDPGFSLVIKNIVGTIGKTHKVFISSFQVLNCDYVRDFLPLVNTHQNI